jgi:hypothetical protein
VEKEKEKRSLLCWAGGRVFGGGPRAEGETARVRAPRGGGE